MDKREYKSLMGAASWRAAIMDHDYSGLSDKDKAACNNWLLRHDVSFVDCHYSEPIGPGLALYHFAKEKRK